ncbi:hypothetical protein OS493_030981, partial [Desmophyllum pertusum]
MAEKREHSSASDSHSCSSKLLLSHVAGLFTDLYRCLIRVEIINSAFILLKIFDGRSTNSGAGQGFYDAPSLEHSERVKSAVNLITRLLKRTEMRQKVTE